MLKKYGLLLDMQVSTPLSAQFKLSKGQSPKTDEEEHKMINISYANTMGSLMYSMVCTIPDVAYVFSIVSRFMSKIGITHWHAVK